MQKEFKKADLKDGMVVEFADGFRGLVLGFKLVGKNSFGLLSDLTKDMKVDGCPAIKVYKVNKKAIFCLNDIFDNALELIWERGIKHMTPEEMRVKLEELTGEKIEVEPSRNEMLGKIYSYCNTFHCGKCCISEECNLCENTFKYYSDEELKQCYEKVMEDGR